MKKLTLSTTALLFSLTVFSQDYFPMVQENNQWNVLQVIFEGGNPWDTTYFTQTYKFTGDTIISSQTYKKVYKSEEEIPVNWIYEGGIREEEEKVWYFSKFSYVEELIYDFTVNVGDTVEFLYYPMLVDSISYKDINGQDRKHIYFSYLDFSPLTEFWIEGIGSNRGVTHSGTAGSLGGWTWFLCMSENGELIYMNPDYNSCFLLSTGTNEIFYPEFDIYPNPANNFLIVKNPNNIKINAIGLFDLSGKKIKEFKGNQDKLNIKDIQTGFYFYTIHTSDFLKSGKILIKN